QPDNPMRCRSVSLSCKGKINHLIRLPNIYNQFPTNAKSWGAARKALNLFLRDVTYNKDLCEYYDLSRIRKWLEIPLDSHVANALKKEPEGVNLPKWCTIKRLTPEISREFQTVATRVAQRKRIARVDLDIYYWLP
ncbi:MAG: hypothetical protein KKE30_03790, partial [Gammaproteobacteria bacterium]|nr:hypothetical protein [Gammaproteobacteria bacterium]MBU1555828.1 hypothetical protein [Gammaproteobacteria bacterium]